MPPLKVDTESLIPALEKLLKKRKIVIVLVYADWCPACRKFKKNVWGPACEKEAMHERVEVESSLVDKVNGLKNANFKYLPSVLLVDEKGQVQEFQSPEGPTNAMPTPKSQEEMTRIMNVKVTPLPNTKAAAPATPPTPAATPAKAATPAATPAPAPEPFAPEPDEMTTPVYTVTNSMKTPAGKVYTPSPMEVSVQKGGNLYQSLKRMTRLNRVLTHKVRKGKGKKKLTRRNRRL
jgi:thiol-disulfide isomerase/thioredoxin